MASALSQEDIVRFAQRDWKQIANHKQARWLARVEGLNAAESIAIGEQLRAQVQVMRPDWPTPSARAEDFEAHRQLSELLKRAFPCP